MRNEFVSETAIGISDGSASSIESSINISGFNTSTLAAIEVSVDITHTWVSDLVLSLRSPKGTKVTLVERRGGQSDDFSNTIFRSDAQNTIREASAPFRGTFRPDGDLTQFNGEPVDGTWTLIVDDKAAQDGGVLKRWTIGLDTNTTPASAFKIQVQFLSGLSPSQQAAFERAAKRWEQIIVGPLAPVMVNGQRVNNLLINIEATGELIDGPRGTLGQAGPTRLRPGSGLPVTGEMMFDTADLLELERKEQLVDVITHEMGHVLGFGTLWNRMRLIQGLDTSNPLFIGSNAIREYAALENRTNLKPVPVANEGEPGGGTFGGHWREVTFGDELLTGFISGAKRPMSRLSIAAFEDMGYRVNYDAADEFDLPTMFRIAELGLSMMGSQRHNNCGVQHTAPTIVPESDMIRE
jgi:subtilisin-like proprotein convertase family protein